MPVSGTAESAWGSGEASVWAEQLKALSPETKVLLTYGKSNGWLDNQPAALTRAYGKGRITYIAAVLDEKLMGTMAAWMTRESGVQPAFGPVPDGVEVSRRSGAGKDVFILLNASQEPKEVTLPHSMKLLLAGKVGASLTLEPYGVELLTNGK